MKILALPLIILLAGCVTATDLVEKHGKPLADKYCAMSPEARAVSRQAIREALAPHVLTIECSE